MGSTARRTDPALWEAVKAEVRRGAKGGTPGQWSARKAQMAVQEYKRRGGTYGGLRRSDNNLHLWTKEEWGTRSGRLSRDSGERYLPKRAREALTEKEYDRTTAKKQRDTRAGLQFSPQPRDIARKTARHRHSGSLGGSLRHATKAELMAEARRRDIPGRSRMGKEALRHALAR